MRERERESMREYDRVRKRGGGREGERESKQEINEKRKFALPVQIYYIGGKKKTKYSKKEKEREKKREKR